MHCPSHVSFKVLETSQGCSFSRFPLLPAQGLLPIDWLPERGGLQQRGGDHALKGSVSSAEQCEQCRAV